MKENPSGQHCSKESLLAHADGELSWQEDAAVSAHLKVCWLCRASLTDLEQQALGLARALAADTFPGPDRIVQARTRLTEWQDEFESHLSRHPRFPAPHGKAFSRLAWGAAMAGSLAAAIWMTLPRAATRFRFEPREAAVPAPFLLPEPPEIHAPGFVAPPLFDPPDPVDLRLLEIEVHYGLHRFRACLGMPIEVALDPPNCVVVRGLVTSVEQKERLEAIFAQRRFPGCFRLDVKTVAEAAPERPGTELTRGAAAAPVEVVGGKLPLQGQLKAYFAQQPGADTADVSRQVADLANQAVGHADQLLAEAWALRRLAERFEDERPDRLPAPAAQLLEAMVRDHLQAVQERRAQLRALLGPPLASFALEGDAAPAAEGVHIGSDNPNWDAVAVQVFHAAERLRASVFALFARAAGPGGGTDEAARLLRLLREPESDLNLAVDALNADFSGHPIVGVHRNPPE